MPDTRVASPVVRLIAFPDMAHDLPGPRRAEIVEEIARNAARARAGSSSESAEDLQGADSV